MSQPPDNVVSGVFGIYREPTECLEAAVRLNVVRVFGPRDAVMNESRARWPAQRRQDCHSLLARLDGAEDVKRVKWLQDLPGDFNDPAVADDNLAAPGSWKAFVAPENRQALAAAIARS